MCRPSAPHPPRGRFRGVVLSPGLSGEAWEAGESLGFGRGGCTELGTKLMVLGEVSAGMRSRD